MGLSGPGIPEYWLLVAFGAVLAAVFLLTSFLLWSFWVGVITVVVIGSIVVQLYGVMEFLGVTLSAVPAVITILAVGLGVEFTMHIILVSFSYIFLFLLFSKLFTRLKILL